MAANQLHTPPDRLLYKTASIIDSYLLLCLLRLSFDAVSIKTFLFCLKSQARVEAVVVFCRTNYMCRKTLPQNIHETIKTCIKLHNICFYNHN